MKKRLFLFVAIVAIVACVFAVSVSADTIKPSTSNAFGELTLFDEAIGRTDIGDKKDDGAIARTVLSDGTNYYTVPTVYLLTKGGSEANGVCLWWDFSGISAKLGYTFTVNSVIRTELPGSIDFLDSSNANSNQYRCFNGFTNVVEIKLNEGLSFIADGTFKAFQYCKALTELDVSMMNFNHPNSTYSVFEYCDSLVTVTLPEEAFVNGEGQKINYATDYMFNGCKALTTVNNLYTFMSGTNRMNQKMFNGCNALENVKIWNGVTSISSEALRGTKISSIVIPESVTTLPNHVFADCKSLQKVVFSSRLTSVGNYCFEKCTALTDIWFPSVSVSFATQVFGQVGASKNINFYFTTASVTVTFSNDSYNNDPVMNAIVKGEGTDRIKLNTPLSKKCEVFFNGHEKPASVNSCTSGGNCIVCATALAGIASEHNLVTTFTYPDGFASKGLKTTVCQNWERCTVANKTENPDPIFTSVGYSYKENTSRSGLTSGFEVKKELLDEYLSYHDGTELVVSIFVVNPTYLGESFFEDGRVVVSGNKGVIQVDISELSYENYNYFISGFSLENMQNLELAFGLLVSDGTKTELVQKTYAQNEESAIKKTYTDNSGYTLSTVTVQSVAPQMVEALLPSNEDQE
ncbi:MAG: leucine-rich repeat domain-containing protein [Ruminococcaceae bacterium]|nr:leucine-rich repeat domain-containing protein [Oscillospiraceae bacterium]